MLSSVYSVATLADRWGCGTDAVYSLIRSGDLRAFKVGGKLLRIRMDEVERYETEGMAASPPTTASFDAPNDTTLIRLERLAVVGPQA